MSTETNVSESGEVVSSTTAGYGIAFAVACIVNAVVMIVKEASEAVHNAMAAITGHHWVTHSFIDLIVFLVLGYILSRSTSLRMTGDGLAKTVVGGAVIGGLIIVGFFVLLD